MWYVSSNNVFWTNTSLEKPDQVLLNTFQWIQLGNNVAVSISSESAELILNINNSNFNLNYRLFKFVNGNYVTYYQLQRWEINDNNYVLYLELDYWCTYLISFFDSNNLTNDEQVFFAQKEAIINDNWYVNSYLTNIYENHKDLNTTKYSYIYEDQVNNTSQVGGEAVAQNTTFYNFYYKVLLMSTAETNLNLPPIVSYIAFAPINFGSSTGAYDTWYNFLWQSTNNYTLDLVGLPIDIVTIANNQIGNDDITTNNEYDFTKNSNYQNLSNLVYCVSSAGLEIQSQISDCWYIYSDDNGINNMSTGGVNALTTQLQAIQSFGWYVYKSNGTEGLSLFEALFPYLMNFKNYHLTYMGQNFSYNYTKFNSLQSFNYFYVAMYFVPNYPTLLLNFVINPTASITGANSQIGSFNFYNGSIPSTTSMSSTFLQQNKSIINTSYAITQRESNEMWMNQAISSANIFNDILHPLKTAEGWTTTAWNNENLWANYSINYGAAKIAQLKKSNTLSSNGLNAGMPNNYLVLNVEKLQEWELFRVIKDLDKFGYLYQKWDAIKNWYINYFHNFVKISNGMEKLLINVPTQFLSGCLNILSQGVIIWTHLINNQLKYVEIEKMYDAINTTLNENDTYFQNATTQELLNYLYQFNFNWHANEVPEGTIFSNDNTN